MNNIDWVVMSLTDGHEKAFSNLEDAIKEYNKYVSKSLTLQEISSFVKIDSIVKHGENGRYELSKRKNLPMG